LSGTYKTSPGDTWNLVARKTSGNDLDADKIRRANPGVPTPIPSGILLQIPGEGPVPLAADLDDISITVDSQKIGTFDNLEIGLSIDAISKASFTVPNVPETRGIFRPLSAPKVVIAANGRCLLTGRCESPVIGDDGKVLTVSCYATAGVLERAHPPLSAFPLEFTNANLLQISNDLCRYHGVACDFQAAPGPLFKRVDIKPGGPVLDFLADLARQRGPVLTSGSSGDLVVWNGIAGGAPVASFVKGRAPVVGFQATIDESKYYSSVTGTIPAKTKRRGAKAKGKGASFTVKNPHANDMVRPFVAEFQDIDEGELEQAVNTMAGRMFADVFKVELELATRKDDAGNLFEPNTTVRVTSEEDFLERPTELLIADLTLKMGSASQTASMRLVLPGVYSGEIPEVLPWR
jgi:prophage tail gpP-like protein